MKGYQKAHLRALGKQLQPAVSIGRKGLTPPVLTELERALDHSELIKVRFTGGKDHKTQLTDEIVAATGAELAGTVGHTALFFRQHSDPEQQTVHLPVRPEDADQTP